MRIVGVVEIITPEQRCVFGGQDREFITVKNAIALLLLAVRPLQEFLVLQLQLFQFLLKGLFGHRLWRCCSAERLR